MKVNLLTKLVLQVDILSKLRHPNLVTLIGACPEAWALIYEYLPNGSLEDRLNCRDNTPPLSWQARIRIAAELCSVLIFLHSNNPDSIVHGDLKPSNILLDANFGSKLSDFGICRVISHDGNSSNSATMCCRTGPKGTFAYMDPEFLSSGELTVKSDVYSFGIILLRLLTGKPAIGITKEVQHALDQGNLNTLLDPLAGDWPFVQAKQLALMALRCSEMNRKSRPDLVSEVWRVLEPMKVSCGASSSSFRVGSEERGQIPPYFICPIFQVTSLHSYSLSTVFSITFSIISVTSHLLYPVVSANQLWILPYIQNPSCFKNKPYWESLLYFTHSSHCLKLAGNHARPLCGSWWVHLWGRGSARMAWWRPQHFTHDKPEAWSSESCPQPGSSLCNSGVVAAALNIYIYLHTPFCILHNVYTKLIFFFSFFLFSSFTILFPYEILEYV